MKRAYGFLCKSAAILMILVIVGCASSAGRKQGSINTAVSADGSLISYAVKGRGEPTIVFVHCWTCDHTFWQHQVAYFSQHYQVVWLDLAGHGLSDSTRSDYTMSAFGEDVAAVVNKVGANRVVLVGHSMGGPVAMEAARILGDKVVAVVGVDTFYTPFQFPKDKAQIEGFLKPLKNDYIGTRRKMLRSMFTPNADPELKASIISRFNGANPEMGISAMHDILEWYAQNVPDALEACSMKLRNINAAPTGNEKPLHESVGLIPGVGHFIPQVKPEEFNDALNRIISAYK